MDTKNTGNAGEDMACRYLKKKGFSIIGRNERERFGEIDIIAKDNSGLLVFIEVKTIRQNQAKEIAELIPEDHMTLEKMRKFRKICAAFANSHPELVNEKLGWRMDVVALTIIDKDFIIEHYENV